MGRADRELSRYSYRFPPKAIAQAPSSPRDAARLLAYRRDRGTAVEATFRDLPKLLPPRSVLVFNDTRVIPARLVLAKATGGKVRVLFLRKARQGIWVLADRKLSIAGTVALDAKKRFRVAAKEGGEYLLAPLFPLRDAFRLFERHGFTPLPPYIKASPLTEGERREKYQTVFAREWGSVAAPTAALHFTKRLIRRLKDAGHDVAFVTLHVNLGTFAPVTERHLAEGKLHAERYEIPRATARALERAKREGRPVIAVGTTSVRTLESATDARGRFRRLRGDTRLFIRPGYRFRAVDGIITNFHVPSSSLLMLVSAFAGRERTLALYRRAIRRGFRLFSFGDGMLIL